MRSERQRLAHDVLMRSSYGWGAGTRIWFTRQELSSWWYCAAFIIFGISILADCTGLVLEEMKGNKHKYLDYTRDMILLV
jgi:hypothetical protein